MKIAAADWKALRQPLAVLAACSLAALAIAGLSRHAGERSATALRQAKARYQALVAESGQLPDPAEERRLAAFVRRLQPRQSAGEDRRSEWAELLGELQRRQGLPELRYQFMPADAAAARGDPPLRSTTMKLHLERLHEEALLAFIDGLYGEPGVFATLRGCTLEKAGETPAGLSVDCVIDWITLDGGQEQRQ